MEFVLMGDIVGSSSQDGGYLMKGFKEIINSVNKAFAKVIKSPLTITLGDEFQGIMGDLSDAVQAIFYIDRLLIDIKPAYRLRYSLYYGPIDTPVNHQYAHEMLGEGLTKARKGLEEMKQHNDHYRVYTGRHYTDEMLNGLFHLYDSIYSNWSEKDKKYLLEFFEKDDYKWVSSQMKKNPSTAWRKRNSLKIEEFNITKRLIQLTVDKFE